MKTNRLLFTVLFIISSWCSAMAYENPIVTIHKSPVNGNGDITPNTEITFSTSTSYPAPPAGQAPERPIVVSYTWNFNDPFGAGENVISGVVLNNPSMSAKHTFTCGSYFVSLTYLTSYGETFTVYSSTVTQGAPLANFIFRTSPSICVSPGVNPYISTQVSLNGPPLSSDPSYTWTIYDKSNNRINTADLLLFWNGDNANGVTRTSAAADGVYVNFNKYPFPGATDEYIIKCVVSPPAPNASCRLETSKLFTFKRGIAAPVVCSTCPAGIQNLCPTSAASVQLGTTPVAGVTYQWTSTVPANGSALTYLSNTAIANPVFTQPAGVTGDLTYTLKNTAANGCTNSTGITFRISTLNLSVPATVKICKTGTLTATLSGGTAPVTFEWTNADNNTQELSSTSIADPTFTCISRTVKTFNVKVTDAAGCSVTKSVEVDAKNSNLNAITGFNMNWCNDSHVINGAQLFSGGTSPFTLASPGATPATSTNATLAGNTFTVTTPAGGNVSVTDGDGCTASGSYAVTGSPLQITITKYNTVNPYLTPYNGIRQYMVCTAGEPASLDVEFSITGGCQNYTYRWITSGPSNFTNDASPGTQLTPNTFRSNLIFQTPNVINDTYLLYIVAQDALGNTKTVPVCLVSTQSPVQPVLTNVCSGQSVTTNAQWISQGTFTAEWIYPDVAQLVTKNSNSVTLTYPNNKLAVVYFNLTNSCGVQQSYTVYKGGPDNLLNAGLDRTICAGSNTQLNATNGSGMPDGYTWTPAAGLSNANAQSTLASPAVTTTYTVSNTPLGCSNALTDNVKITVSPSTTASWRRGFTCTEFYTPAVDNVICTKNSNQIFYRTGNNQIHSMYYDTESQTWKWSGLYTVTNVAGDLAISPNGQIFYRTTDNKLHSLKWTPANGWQPVIPVATVNNVQGPIVATNNEVFYRTTDNKIQSIYLNGGTWTWSPMYDVNGNNVTGGNANNAMGYNYADGKLYYRTQGNKLHCLSKTAPTVWERSDLNNIAGTSVGNSITFATNGQIFYKTTNGQIQSLYKNGGNWAWSGLNYPTNVAGDLLCDQNDRVFFRTNNNTLNYLYWTPANGWQTNSMDNVTSKDGTNSNGMALSSSVAYDNIAVDAFGVVYFRTSDGRIRNAYYEGDCDFKISNTRAPENPSNTINGIRFQDYASWRHNDVYYYNSTYTSCSGSGTINTIRFIDQPMSCRVSSQHSGNLIRTETNLPYEHFNATYTGYIYVPIDGVYAFYLTSDDGSEMWIGNKLVVDNDYLGEHESRERTGYISLKAGKHAYTIKYNNNLGGRNISLFYEGPTLYKQRVPDNAYFIVSSSGRTANENPTSVIEKDHSEILFYPNPFSHSLKVMVKANVTEGEKARIQLHNILGVEVYATDIKVNAEEELLIDSPAGIYIGTVTYSNGSVLQFKVVKE